MFSGVEIENGSYDLDHASFMVGLLSLGKDLIESICVQNLTTSSFSCSRDMVGPHQNLNVSCDLTTPLSGMVCHP